MPGLIGMNIAWYNFDLDFGYLGTRPPAWASGIDCEFVAPKALGVGAVRWWLYCSGSVYPPTPVIRRLPSEAPPSGGWNAAKGGSFGVSNPNHFDNDGYEVGPPSQVSDLFLADFRLMLTKRAGHDMKLIPSLISFDFCFKASGGGKGGRYDYIVDPQKRAAFLHGVLEPIVAVVAQEGAPTANGYRRFRDIVVAFEVMNEPEWATAMNTPMAPTFRQALVPYDTMTAFLRAGCRIVNQAGIPSTVGFVNNSAMARDRSIGVTVPQIHLYAGWSDFGGLNLGPAGSEAGLVVGELGDTLDPDQDAHWRYRIGFQRANLAERLNFLLNDGGAAAVFLWPFNKKEGEFPSTSLSARQRAQITDAAKRLR